MSEPLTQAEFEALVKRTGLPLTPENIADLYSAWPHYARFAARLRNPETFDIDFKGEIPW